MLYLHDCFSLVSICKCILYFTLISFSYDYIHTPDGVKCIKQERMSEFKQRKRMDRFDGMPEEEVMKKSLPDHLSHGLDIVIVSIIYILLLVVIFFLSYICCYCMLQFNKSILSRVVKIILKILNLSKMFTENVSSFYIIISL